MYRQLTLRPARFTTASQPSSSAAHAPSVRPSQRTSCARRGLRLSTTTECPAAVNALSATAPTCPDPPGITIFILCRLPFKRSLKL